MPTQLERRRLAPVQRLAGAERWALPGLALVDRPPGRTVAEEPERIIGVR